jgi:hypothetical protein
MRRESVRANKARRYDTTFLAWASRCTKPRLEDNRRRNLGTYPFRLAGHRGSCYAGLGECSLKNRTISAEASGPLGSV